MLHTTTSTAVQVQVNTKALIITNPFLREDAITGVKSYYTREFQELPLTSILAPYRHIGISLLIDVYKDLDYITVGDIMDSQGIAVDLATEVIVALMEIHTVVTRAIEQE